MKKNYFLLIVAGIILLTAIVLRLTSREDDWLCQNGQWVRHGNPSAPQPTTLCPGAPVNNNNPAATTTNNQDDNNPPATTTAEIEVFSPKPETLIKSPLVILGQARGNWFFEASLPVRLVDANDNVVTSTPGQAQSDWMTSDFVPFTATLNFEVTASTTDTGYLVVAKDNPSGLPENDASFQVPVKFR